ncbi:MAG: DeoR/GlpR transcriptional regulator [Cyanobacteria bacterium SZAS LIN-2]|nr:DeoR/GlpR transcriptional regulator [Cyanobacteria bacterium SZAS LIN-2]
MLTEERKNKILERLASSGKVLSSDLTVRLGVSEDTIRRDLKDLAEAGLLKRVHGGALPLGQVPFQYDKREKIAVGEKLAIAKTAASYVRSGQIVFIDGGTTTAQIARFIPADLKATFITYSLPTAQRLAEVGNLEVIILGGRVQKELLLTMGPSTLSEIGAIQADLCLISVESVHTEYGATVSNIEDAAVKRMMIEHSAETLALAGAEKLGTVSPFLVAKLKDLSYIVTDQSAPAAFLKDLKAQGVSVIKA